MKPPASSGRLFSSLFHNELGFHVVVVWAADNSADNLVFTLGRVLERNSGRLSWTHGLFNLQVGHIKAMLDIGRGNFQFGCLVGLYVNHCGLNRVFLHHDLDVCIRR